MSIDALDFEPASLARLLGLRYWLLYLLEHNLLHEFLLLCGVSLLSPLSYWLVQVCLVNLKERHAILVEALGTGGILFAFFSSVGALFFAWRKLRRLGRLLGLLLLRMRSFKCLSNLELPRCLAPFRCLLHHCRSHLSYSIMRF